jgi:hypothetical protein
MNELTAIKHPEEENVLGDLRQIRERFEKDADGNMHTHIEQTRLAVDAYLRSLNSTEPQAAIARDGVRTS